MICTCYPHIYNFQNSGAVNQSQKVPTKMPVLGKVQISRVHKTTIDRQQISNKHTAKFNLNALPYTTQLYNTVYDQHGTALLMLPVQFYCRCLNICPWDHSVRGKAASLNGT